MKKGFFLPLALLAAAAACRRPNDEPIAPAEPRPIPGRAAAAAPLPPLKIQELYPHDASAGVGFDIQFDGTSPMGVAGDGFSPRSVVFFDDQPLATSYGNGHALVAAVPPELLARARKISVTVRDIGPPPRESAPLAFDVLPPRRPGACPRIQALYPAFTRVATAFGTQPDGSSALGVAGENFGPKTVLAFGGVEVKTKYQGPSSLVAFLPPDLLRRPGSVPVTLADPECRRPRGRAAKFEIRP